MAKEDVDFVSTQATTDFVAHETMIVTLSHPGLSALDIEDSKLKKLKIFSLVFKFFPA